MIQKFEFKKMDFSDALLITPFCAVDGRGALIKDYNIDVFAENGIYDEIKEVFYTVSKKGVIRALHFQAINQQAKIVRCVKGCVYDVIVDLRPESETFGKWQGVELSEEKMNSIYVPERFGHGYLVLEDSVVSYKCNNTFDGENDSGIKFDDTDIGIDWPYDRIGGIENLIISEKDRQLQSFAEFKKGLEVMW